MFEAHDRRRFEPHAFSFGADDGLSPGRRLEETFHTFHDVSPLSDVDAARAIHDASIDTLIDLN